MKERTISHHLRGHDRSIVIKFDYTEAQPVILTGSNMHPDEPAEVTINQVLVGGPRRDILAHVTPAQLEEIEQACHDFIDREEIIDAQADYCDWAYEQAEDRRLEDNGC